MGTAGSSLRKTGQSNSQVTLSALWGSSWSTIQGIASDLIGTDESTDARQRSPGTRRRRKNSKPGLFDAGNSTPPKQWGPKSAVPLPASSHVATGTREEREALVRAQKRKDLLSGHAAEYADALGHFKRRTSEDRTAISALPGDGDDREALVYIHHVQQSDTLAGITIKYGCQAATLRKSNRMWPNDTVQSRKVLVLPVDACSVKGKLMAEPDVIDLVPTESDEDRNAACSSNLQGKQPVPVKQRNESTSSSSERPSSSSVISSSSTSDQPWTHDSWVQLPNNTSPTQIARLSRRTLGYFPPARRKSQSYSDLDTPSTSLDILRQTNSSTFFENATTSPARSSNHDSLQRPRRTRKLSNASNGYFPSYLAGPGGVGTMAKNVKSPGPAQDGLNKLFAGHLPNVAPPPNQQNLYLPDLPIYTDDPLSGSATPLASGMQSPGLNLENVGGAIESWVRKMATKASTKLDANPLAENKRRDHPARASVGVPGRGAGGIGDLIEMADSFEIGGGDDEDSEEEEERRGRQASVVATLDGAGIGIGGGGGDRAVGTSSYFGHDVLRGRARSGTAAGPKSGKDD